MKFGVVDFLNAYPLYYYFESNLNYLLIRDIPSRLSEMLYEKKVDIALVSSIEYYNHREKYSFFPKLCISSQGPVESIRLFLPGYFNPENNEITKSFLNHMAKFQDNRFTFYFDNATKSSVIMLQIIINHFFPDKKFIFRKINPPYDEKLFHNLENNEALLLIGDAALTNRNRLSIDLGQWYNDIFNLPFVYAMWIYHQNIDNFDFSILNDAYQYSENNFAKMVFSASERFKFDAEFIKKYLSKNISYSMDNTKLNGLEYFFTKYENIKDKFIITK